MGEAPRHNSMNQPAPPEIHRIFHTLDKTASYPYSQGIFPAGALESRPGDAFPLQPAAGVCVATVLLKAFGAKIGPHSGMRSSVRIFHPWLFEMGDWSMLGARRGDLQPGARDDRTSHRAQPGRVRLRRHARPHEAKPAADPPADHDRRRRLGGGEAFVGPNVTIGDNCVIGRARA